MQSISENLKHLEAQAIDQGAPPGTAAATLIMDFLDQRLTSLAEMIDFERTRNEEIQAVSRRAAEIQTSAIRSTLDANLLGVAELLEARLREAETAKADVERLINALGWANMSVSDAVAHIAGLRENLAASETVVATMRSSYSWRLSRPLRRAAAFLKKRPQASIT